MMTTDRLELREPGTADAELLRDYYRRNAERFAPWEPHRPDDLAFHARWIADARARPDRADRPAAFLAFRKEVADLVAVVTLDGFSSEDPPSAMLAYSVDGAYERQGYASEAVARVIRYAFEALGLSSLSAYYHPDNARSAKLLERLGFAIVGRTPVVPGLEALMRPQVMATLLAARAR